MPDEQGGAGRRGVFRTNRIEAFSDGVFAIAITILVLELAVPLVEGADAWSAFLEEWPSYVAYVISFATVGALWMEHIAITEHLRHTDAGFTRLNLLLLMVVSFIPFPTGLISEFHGDATGERVAVTIYGVTLFAASCVIGLLWFHARREDLVRSDVDDRDIRTLTKRLTPSLAAYVVMILTGLVLPFVAVFGYLVLAIFLMVPVRKRRAGGVGQQEA